MNNAQTMNCRKVRLLIPSYHDKRLDRRDAQRFESHLEACTGCATEYAKIEELTSSLRALADIEIPLAIARQLRPALLKPSAVRCGAGVARFFIARERTIRRYAAEAGFIAVLLVVGAAVLRLDIFHLNPPVSRPPAAQPGPATLGTQPPVSLKGPTKPKQTEPGAEAALQGTNDGVLNGLPRPAVAGGHGRYSRSDVDDAMVNTAVSDFTLTYTIAQAKTQRGPILKDIASQAARLGEDGARIHGYLDRLLSTFGKPALPAYVEKANFEGKDAWIIIVTWNDGSSGDRLSKASVFVVDPQTGAIAYTK